MLKYSSYILNKTENIVLMLFNYVLTRSLYRTKIVRELIVPFGKVVA